MAMGRRALRNVCLHYLAAADTEHGVERALAQFQTGNNMTDVLAALHALNRLDRPERDAALAAFYQRWSSDDLVVDKWFALQAMSPLPNTVEAVARLARHPAFDLLNPNRFRALFGGFSQGNPVRFHAEDGSGYRLLTDYILQIEPRNPQIAARAIQPLGHWRRHEPKRGDAMRAELERILAAPNLSKNCFEMASKSLH
jgi:aminopeptidase N